MWHIDETELVTDPAIRLGGFVATAHADLAWPNLTAPNCYILEWEAWGLAPRSFDSRSGQLYYCARVVTADLHLRRRPK